MAHFVAWRGPNLKSGAPSISKSIKKSSVGQAFRFGIWGGDDLKIAPNNPAIAEINSRESVEGATNNIAWFELVGRQTGNVMIEARHSGNNAVYDYFQLVVESAAAAKQRPTVEGVNFSYQVDTKGIGPNWNASMILTLPIALIPIKGGLSVKDADGTNFTSLEWGTREWNNWAAAFVKTIRAAWSEKFWLRGPAALNELEVANPAGGRCRVHLHCVLNVELVAPALATQKIQVVKAKSLSFRSNSSRFDDLDLKPMSPAVSGFAKPFNTVVHEIGHNLGLHHPFEKTNPSNQYCVAGHPDCNEIMGQGNELRPKYAAPWQNAAATWFNTNAPGRFLRASDFAASTTRLLPDPI